MTANRRIAIVGLGYVGLPLAVALAKRFAVIGFDIDRGRIDELKDGHDRTGEIGSEALKASRIVLSADAAAMRGCDIFIVTVPTPVDDGKRPDLAAVRAACDTVGGVLGTGAIVVLESTVYPGVTEEICGPILAKASGLVAGRDFFLGYSPERINPGDREHTVERITKVVAGQTPAVAGILAEVYGAITSGGTFIARNIVTAEAAKVIENAQRDINIAFINEVTMIFNRLGLSIYDVLEASATKWNFLNFRPGLVGGHCIGVDPYYLAEFAAARGHHPEIILAGRRINDAMGGYVAAAVLAELERGGGPAAEAGRPILVLGLTFKENVPDLRNSRVIDIIEALKAKGRKVDVHDPCADPAMARHEYGIQLRPTLDGAPGYAAIIGAVPHQPYLSLTGQDFARLLGPNGLIADIKGIWRKVALPKGIRRWEL